MAKCRICETKVEDGILVGGVALCDKCAKKIHDRYDQNGGVKYFPVAQGPLFYRDPFIWSCSANYPQVETEDGAAS